MIRKMLFILAGIMAVAGIVFLSYSSFANFINGYFSYQVILEYNEDMANADDEELARKIELAQAYNKTLPRSFPADPFTGENIKDFKGTEFENFDMVQNGAMLGYLEIPSIDVYLPIYYGTDDEVLSKAVGVVENTSLPVGGNGSHSAISGHTGLSSRKIFTDLNLMNEGDPFFIHILNRDFAYSVDQIKVVLPTQAEDLMIMEDSDLVTLITCTPFGVNDHRLLVRGRRTDYDFGEGEDKKPTTVDTPYDPKDMYTWIILFTGLVICLVAVPIIIRTVRRKRARKIIYAQYTDDEF